MILESLGYFLCPRPSLGHGVIAHAFFTHLNRFEWSDCIITFEDHQLGYNLYLLPADLRCMQFALHGSKDFYQLLTLVDTFSDLTELLPRGYIIL